MSSSSSSTSSVHSHHSPSSSSSSSAPGPSHSNIPSVLAPAPASTQQPFNNFPTTPPHVQQPHYYAYTPSYPFHPTSPTTPITSNQWSSLPPQHAHSAPLPRTLGADPYAYLYTSSVPDVPGANGTGPGGRHPIVGRRQRVSVACTYCRRRKIRCDGADVCSNCSRASRQCEYTAVTEESIRRERDLSQRRRRNAPTETPMPFPSGYVSNVLGSPMSEWSPTSEYLTSPTGAGAGTGFTGPTPAWSNGTSPGMGYERPSVDLNSPAIPQSPSMHQRGFQQPSYPSSSLSGYGQPSSWQPTHATSSSTSSTRSIGRPFQNVSIGTPFPEFQYGMIGSTDTSFYMGNQTLSPTPASSEEYYRPQLSRMSTYPMATPRYTPNSRSNSPLPKGKNSYSYLSNALASPPRTPLFEVPTFNYSINPSELQPIKGMSGLNIMVPVPTTTSPIGDDGMRHLFEGVQGLEANTVTSVIKIRPPPPPYSIMA